MTINCLMYGNNYTGTDNELNGCINDILYWDRVYKFAKASKSRSLKNKDCRKSLMVEAMEEAVSKTPDQGTVYINYSAHGTIVPPGIQSWVPDDFDWGNPKTWFTYDEIDHILMKHEKRGVLAVVISDSCHSKADPRKHFRSLGNPHKVRNRFLAPPPDVARRIVSDPFHRNVLSVNQDDLLLSGCRRDQTSADAYIDGAYRGAFTYALSTALAPYLAGKAKAPSYRDAVLKARAWLAYNGYDQVCSVDGDPKVAALPFFTSLPLKKTKKRKAK